jgi:hypothetical protein
MRLAYADPPYPGCAHLYQENTEVDHEKLIRQLTEYDGWLLHTSSTALLSLATFIPKKARLMAWVKPFAAFKRNVSVAYAWEPVIVMAARKPVVRPGTRYVSRDWIAASCTLKTGLCGAKPLDVAWWGFEMLGAEPGDTLDDLYPGTNAVGRAWTAWRASRALLDAEVGDGA